MMQSLADIKTRLEELGAVFETEDSGYIPTKPALKKAQILEYSVKDITPITRVIRQSVIRDRVYSRTTTLSRYGITGIFRRTCVKFINPRIYYWVSPVRVRNITCHLLSGRLTGEIVNRLNNWPESEDGKEGHYTTWRWRSCPTDESAYDWHVVDGSSSIFGDWSHLSIEDETSSKIVSVSQIVKEKVPHGNYVDVLSSFETTGLLNIIESLLRIFIRGSVKTRNGFDVAVKWNWKGQTQVANHHIDAKVVLPVQGNVNWKLD